MQSPMSCSVDVWLVQPDSVSGSALSAFRSVMSRTERERENRFRMEQDRLTHVIARGLARNTLSIHAPVEPSVWEFRENHYGRPEIIAPSAYAGLKFNISHTKGLVACAATSGMEIGVDVESVDRITDFDRIAKRCFAPEENAALALLPGEKKKERFFAYWTLKESYIKARGVGLSLSTSRFAFFLKEDRAGRLFPEKTRFDPDMNENPGDWQFFLQCVGTSHFAALSVKTGGAAINVCFRDYEVR